MDQPLSINELRSAVTDLTTALLEHQPLSDDQWDHAISTLLVAREQHGGRLRQLIHTVLAVGRGQPVCQLRASLMALRAELASCEQQQRIRITAPAAANATRRRSAVLMEQLGLFNDAAQGGAAPRPTGRGLA